MSGKGGIDRMAGGSYDDEELMHDDGGGYEGNTVPGAAGGGPQGEARRGGGDYNGAEAEEAVNVQQRISALERRIKGVILLANSAPCGHQPTALESRSKHSPFWLSSQS